jgi:hypothetical protein
MRARLLVLFSPLLFGLLEQGISIGLVVLVRFGASASRPGGWKGFERVRVGQEIELLAELFRSQAGAILAPLSVSIRFPI